MDYKIIHIASHGALDLENPEYSGLIFGNKQGQNEDGILQSHEIFPMALKSDLVVLSSCFSGFGEVDPDEGILGIHSTFLTAGSKSVIVSLWPVEDRSTAMFFKEFYKNLNNDNSKASALRLAREYLMNTKKYNSPFFWAPFVLIGES